MYEDERKQVQDKKNEYICVHIVCAGEEKKNRSKAGHCPPLWRNRMFWGKMSVVGGQRKG